MKDREHMYVGRRNGPLIEDYVERTNRDRSVREARKVQGLGIAVGGVAHPPADIERFEER